MNELFSRGGGGGGTLRAYSFGTFSFQQAALSSVFGRLQNPVLLVLSSKIGRFRRPSKPSAS